MSLSLDEALNVSQQTFMARHRAVCASCRRAEDVSSLALNMLRQSALEPSENPHYEDRLFRRLRLQNVRQSVNYWSPAIVGAAIAGLAIVTALQMIAQPSSLPHVPLENQSAHRAQFQDPQLPSLEILKQTSQLR